MGREGGGGGGGGGGRGGGGRGGGGEREGRIIMHQKSAFCSLRTCAPALKPYYSNAGILCVSLHMTTWEAICCMQWG